MIFGAYILDGITYLMYYTKLYGSVRINTLNGFRKTFQTIYTGYENIFHSTILKIRQDTKP